LCTGGFHLGQVTGVFKYYMIWVKVPPESRAGAIANAFPESSAKDSYGECDWSHRYRPTAS